MAAPSIESTPAVGALAGAALGAGIIFAGARIAFGADPFAEINGTLRTALVVAGVGAIVSHAHAAHNSPAPMPTNAALEKLLAVA